MNADGPHARRPYPTPGSLDQSFHPSLTDPGKFTRRRVATWLIAAMLVALPMVGSSAATAARSTRPRPASCPRVSKATGASWHIKHYFYQYNSAGNATDTLLPASGDRYNVIAGSAAYCRLTHKWIRRLTSAEPDAGSSGRTISGLHVPVGEGLLYSAVRRGHYVGGDVPPGFVCYAQLDETGSNDGNGPSQKGDNTHDGLCMNLRTKVTFIWAADLPREDKYMPAPQAGG